MSTIVIGRGGILFRFYRKQNPFNPKHAIFKNNCVCTAAYHAISDHDGVTAEIQIVLFASWYRLKSSHLFLYFIKFPKIICMRKSAIYYCLFMYMNERNDYSLFELLKKKKKIHGYINLIV